VLNLLPSPDGKHLVALNCGHSPHGLAVLDAATFEVKQTVGLKSAWLGLAWAPDGKTLFGLGRKCGGSFESHRRADLRVRL
jgi:hypothetical protein